MIEQEKAPGVSAEVGDAARGSGPADATLAGGPDSYRRRNVVALLLIAFGVGLAALMPALVALPLVVARISPADKDAVLGTLLGTNAFLGMALAPLFGALSDRTTSRFGMRRPGMALGGAAVIAGQLILGAATNIPMLYLGSVVSTIGATVSGASSFAVIPDVFPDRVRGRILALKALVGSAAGMSASIVAPMLIGDQMLLFGAGAAVLAVCYLVALPLIDDRRLDPGQVSKESLLRAAFNGYRFDPRTAPDFSWVFASRFVITLGISFATSFAVYFLTDHLKITGAEVEPLISLNAVMSLAGTAVGSLAGAIVADKVGSRRNMVLLTSLVMAGGVLIAAFAPSAPVFFIGTACLTVAIGMFIPTDGALVMSVLPGGNAHSAKFMSIITIADQLPRSIGPMVAPAVIALGGGRTAGGFPVLYMTAAVVAVLGGLLVRKVRSVR